MLKSELYHTREEQHDMLENLDQMKAKVKESKKRVVLAERAKDQNKELLNNVSIPPRLLFYSSFSYLQNKNYILYYILSYIIFI